MTPLSHSSQTYVDTYCFPLRLHESAFIFSHPLGPRGQATLTVLKVLHNSPTPPHLPLPCLWNSGMSETAFPQRESPEQQILTIRLLLYFCLREQVWWRYELPPAVKRRTLRTQMTISSWGFEHNHGLKQSECRKMEQIIWIILMKRSFACEEEQQRDLLVTWGCRHLRFHLCSGDSTPTPLNWPEESNITGHTVSVLIRDTVLHTSPPAAQGSCASQRAAVKGHVGHHLSAAVRSLLLRLLQHRPDTERDNNAIIC